MQRQKNPLKTIINATSLDINSLFYNPKQLKGNYYLTNEIHAKRLSSFKKLYDKIILTNKHGSEQTISTHMRFE